jgi:hypothetical protein
MKKTRKKINPRFVQWCTRRDAEMHEKCREKMLRFVCQISLQSVLYNAVTSYYTTDFELTSMLPPLHCAGVVVRAARPRYGSLFAGLAEVWRAGGLEPPARYINSFGNWQCRILHAATLLHPTPRICFAAPWGHGHMEVALRIYSFV